MTRQTYLICSLLVAASSACSGGTGDSKDPVEMQTPGATPEPVAPGEPVGNEMPSEPTPSPTPEPTPSSPTGTSLQATEQNNYEFSSTLSINVVSVSPSQSEGVDEDGDPVYSAPNGVLNFDWTGLSEDLLEHDVDPLNDVDMVTLVMWSLTQEELEAKLNADELAQSDVAAIVSVYTENAATSTTLYDFTTFGEMVGPTPEKSENILLSYLDTDIYPPDQFTYTVMAASGTQPGQGTYMVQGFRLDPNTDNTSVVVGDDSTSLEYSVDVASATPTMVPAGAADIALDWGDLAVTALGTEFFATDITEALVARYPFDVAGLEDNFLDLELEGVADRMYRASITSGTEVDFSELTNDAGESFSGIDAEGTWVVALFCGGCANPAPWYLSQLQPK